MVVIPKFGVADDRVVGFIAKNAKGQSSWQEVPYDLESMSTLGYYADLAEKLNLDRIWFHHSIEAWSKVPDNLIKDALVDTDVFPAKNKDTNEYDQKTFEDYFYYFCHRIKDETYTPNREIGFLTHMKCASGNNNYLVKQEDSIKDIYSAFYYLEKLIGLPVRKSSGGYCQDFIKAVTKDEKLVSCKNDLKPFTESTGVITPFTRKLTEGEKKKKYFMYIDKNANFLASSNISLGIGNYHKVYSPTFNKLLPGLWNCEITGTSIFDGIQAPKIIRDFKKGGNWLYTSTVKLLIDLGYQVNIKEALIWNEYSAILEAWFNRMKDIYIILKTDTEQCKNARAREISLSTFKEMYVRGLSTMSHEDSFNIKNNDRSLNRPDFYHLIISEAYQRMIRNIITYSSSTITYMKQTYTNIEAKLPILFINDGLGYCTDFESVTEAFPFLRTEVKVGHFKLVHKLPMSMCIDILNSDLDATHKLSNLHKIAKEHKGE